MSAELKKIVKYLVLISITPPPKIQEVLFHTVINLVEIIFCFVLPEHDILSFSAKGSTGFNSKFYLGIRVDGRYIVIFSTHVYIQYDTVKLHMYILSMILWMDDT